MTGHALRAAARGAALLLGHTQDWRSMRWLGALGSFVGFLLLPVVRHAGVAEMGNWMLLYAGMSVAGALAVSAGRHSDAEPLAISAVATAYAAAALLAWASPAGAVSDGAMFGYLIALAAGVLLVTSWFRWATFSGLGMVAAFLATALLYDRLPGGGPSHYPIMYLAMLAAGALGVSGYRQERTLGTIVVVGVFAALPMTGMMGHSAPALVAPVYLALVAIATLAAIEWRRWYGLEWVALAGTWSLYLIWRATSGHGAADPASLNFSSVYLLAFLAATWVRHGVRGARARTGDSLLACANAAAYAAVSFYDLREVQAMGLLALGMCATYVAAGVAGIRRREAQACFGPVLVGIGVFFLTLAIPMLARGYHITALWALEVAALMGLGFYFRAPALRGGALVVLVLPLLKAITRDSLIDPDSYQVIVNSRALSMLAVIAAMYVSAWCYARFREQLGDGEHGYGVSLTAIATVLLLWICSSEAWCYVGWQRGMDRAAQQFALSGVWVVFGTVLMALGTARDISSLRWAGLSLFAATTVKVFSVDPPLQAASYLPLINAQTAPLLAMTAVLYAAGTWCVRAKEADESDRSIGAGMLVAATGLLLWIASAETWRFVGWTLGHGEAVQQFALSGVWVVFGAVLMGVGVARNVQALRWAALGLLGVTILKVFAGQPSLTPATYVPVGNAQATPLLAIAGLLFVAGAWYARAREADEAERQAGIGAIVVATGLLLWVASAEAWRVTGWQLDRGPAAQYAALSAVWIIFSIVLLALGTQRDSAALRWTGLALLGVTALKVLGMDPPLTDSGYVPLANPYAGPLLAIVALLFVTAAWFARTKDADDPERSTGTALVIAATGLLLWVASSEAWFYLGWRTDAGEAGQHMALSMVWLIFGSIMLVMGLQRGSIALRAVGLVALGLVAAKVLVVDPRLTAETYRLLANHYAFPLLLIAAMLYLASHWYRRNVDYVGAGEEMVAAAMPYVASVLLWWVLTTEAWHFVEWALGARGDAQQYALSAVWTVYGAALIWVGLVRRNPPLRWMAMGLLAITIVKVFVLDLRALDLPLRIAALLLLGVALIGVGFGYQRLVREQAEQAEGED